MPRIDDAKSMFVREKTVNGYTYLYLVENVREDGRTKQRIIRNLGRKEAVLASGALDRLVASIGRFAERSLVLRAIDEGDTRLEVRRIGAPLLFGRLWEETGCRAVVSQLLTGRGFGFDVERAVFVAVLHRLMVSGSDRSCAHWMADYTIPGAEGLTLHRFYRAMAWLGEEIEPGDLAPRCVKDLIEETLFERRRDLFSDLGVVFMDTTSLSFGRSVLVPDIGKRDRLAVRRQHVQAPRQPQQVAMRSDKAPEKRMIGVDLDPTPDLRRKLARLVDGFQHSGNRRPGEAQKENPSGAAQTFTHHLCRLSVWIWWSCRSPVRP